jgi:hypothetical protein
VHHCWALDNITMHAPLKQEWEPHSGANVTLLEGQHLQEACRQHNLVELDVCVWSRVLLLGLPDLLLVTA